MRGRGAEPLKSLGGNPVQVRVLPRALPLSTIGPPRPATDGSISLLDDEVARPVGTTGERDGF